MRMPMTAAGLSAVLAVAVAMGAPAEAAKARCHVVTDKTGDATNVPGTGQSDLPNQDDLDITSADVATNRGFLTTVIRVRDLGAVLAAAPRTREYLVYFHMGKTDYATSAKHFPDTDVFWLDGGAPGEGDARVDPLGVGSNYKVVSGVFDVAHSEVRVSVPRGLFRVDGPVKAGSSISNISAATYQGVGADAAAGAGVAGEEDRSDGLGGRYVLDSPSCVTPGR